MSVPRGRSPPKAQARHRHSASTDDENSMLSSRQLEAFGRTLNATASHLIGTEASQHYHAALGDIHRELRRPMIQRSVFALSQASPRELVRSNFNSSEIQQRALAFVPDELLRSIPPPNNASYSLFQGFQASQPDEEPRKKRHGRHASKDKHRKLIGGADDDDAAHPGLSSVRRKKEGLDHKLEMMSIRKNLCASEIMELDKKIANLTTMRRHVVGRLAGLEQDESELEHELSDVTNQLEELQVQVEEDEAATAQPSSPTVASAAAADKEESSAEPTDENVSFMSESIYEKLPSPKSKKKRMPRRVSMPILHEHLEPGSKIREFQAHNDTISALDFDVPFGTMVSAALDDTLRVWDLNAGRCIGMLEGHLSSVRCVQVEENLVASGSNDATVRLWDLAQADYSTTPSSNINKQQGAGQDHDRQGEDDEDDDGGLFSATSEAHSAQAAAPSASSMADCPLYTLSSHVAEVTALHFSGNTLVSGSADKTLRQWDLETGRCVQTLDVLWAAAQASAVNPSFAPNPATDTDTSTTANSNNSWWRPASGRMPAAEADFVGALQCFQSAVACGTADSVIRLWDLRSGMVQRSLIGHTGPVTALQFDDVHLVTGSVDRSIRIWDLRTGSIFDAFAYDNPITSMMFDHRRICAAAGEAVVKVYDKADGRHWDAGAGMAGSDDSDAVDEPSATLSVVEKVRIRDGYLVEGRKDGVVGVWSC